MEGKYILGFEINYARKSNEIKNIKTNDELELVIAAIDTSYVNVTSNQINLY